MALTLNRFVQKKTGTHKQAQPLPSHSAHTASMIAQAARVPRLAKINTASRAIAGGRVTTKGKR